MLCDGVDATSEEIIEWCRNQIAGYKRPRRITFINADEMPRTATGKIQHNQLREFIASREH